MYSERLAESVNTNPIVMRRILDGRQKAGLLVSKSGPRGSSGMAVDAEEVTLGDKYDAVEDADLFHLHHVQSNQFCPVGGYIQKKMCNIIGKPQQILY